jgi:hypothetical protein
MLTFNTSFAISINARLLLLKNGPGDLVSELEKRAKTRKRHNKTFSSGIIKVSELAFKTTRCGFKSYRSWIYIYRPPWPIFFLSFFFLKLLIIILCNQNARASFEEQQILIALGHIFHYLVSQDNQ